jgi:hypothetical protein
MKKYSPILCGIFYEQDNHKSEEGISLQTNG